MASISGEDTGGSGRSDHRARQRMGPPSVAQAHQGLLKAESTIGTLLRTEHIGMNDYLHRRKVPGDDSSLCECGWPKQTVKHILLFCPRCPRFAPDSDKIVQEASSSDFSRILSTPQGIRAAARWSLRQDKFSLVRNVANRKRRKAGRR